MVSVPAIAGSIISLAAFLAFLLFASRFFGAGDARMSKDEKRLFGAHPALWKGARALYGLARRKRAEGKEEKAVEKQEHSEEKVEKRQGAPSGELPVVQAAEQDSEAAVQHSNLESAQLALQGKGLGVVSAVWDALDLVTAFVRHDRELIPKEEQDIGVVKQMNRQLGNSTRFTAIDARAADYLQQRIFTPAVAAMHRSAEDEHEKERFMGELIGRLRKITTAARRITSRARAALGRVRGMEQRERRSFKNEMRDIKRALKDKKTELGRLRRSKRKDPRVISQLEREIKLMESQLSRVEGLEKQLNSTYDTMDREFGEMKRLLSAIIRTEKHISSDEKSVGKREHDVEGRYDRLKKLVQKLEKLNESFGMRSDPHEMAVKFSGEMPTFYDDYLPIVQGDLAFDSLLEQAMRRHITIALEMSAFERLSLSLDEAERAVESGIAASISLISSIVLGHDVQNSLKQLQEDLAKAGGGMEYAERLEQFTQRLSLALQRALRSVTMRVDELRGEDQKLLAELEGAKEQYSIAIGSTMGAMVNLKMQVDKRYLSQADTFEQQLAQRNSTAAAAYRQARGLERTAQGGVAGQITGTRAA